MKKDKNPSANAPELRRRAKARPRAAAAKGAPARTEADTQRLVHEVQVHQIELEMQNEELRRAHVELDTARARYFDYFELAPVGYCTISEEGLILEANLTATSLMGVARHALAKRPITRFIFKEDHDLFYLHRKKLFETGKPQACDLRMLRQDGTQFWAHLAATTAQDADGATVCRVVLSDITEHKLAEEARRESEKKYRSLVENISDIVFTVNIQGLFTYISPVAERIFGYTPEEVIGQSFSRFIFQDDLPMLMERFHMMLAGEVDPADYRILTKTGDVRWVRSSSRPVMVDGKAVAIQGLISDITERKQIENAQLFLLQCGWSASGEDFFQALARYLAETLGMDYVCIDRLEGDGLAAKTVAVYCDGKFEDNLAYALKDTPCGDVVGKTICSFPRDVRHLFPRDAALQEMMAESYAGTTLWSSRGQPIGLIAVIGRKPRADLHLAEAILKVVAIRAAGELERRQAEAETKRLASFPMLNPNFVVEVDVAGHVHFCNFVAEQMFPDLCQRGLGHPWLADWESVLRNLREGGSKSMAREVLVDEKWYEQTIHFVEDVQRVRIYGADITARKQASEALLKAYDEVEKRVVERTAELVKSNKDLELEIEDRKKSGELLQQGPL